MFWLETGQIYFQDFEFLRAAILLSLAPSDWREPLMFSGLRSPCWQVTELSLSRILNPTSSSSAEPRLLKRETPANRTHESLQRSFQMERKRMLTGSARMRWATHTNCDENFRMSQRLNLYALAPSIFTLSLSATKRAESARQLLQRVCRNLRCQQTALAPLIWFILMWLLWNPSQIIKLGIVVKWKPLQKLGVNKREISCVFILSHAGVSVSVSQPVSKYFNERMDCHRIWCSRFPEDVS